jgi:hypothetical protein
MTGMKQNHLRDTFWIYLIKPSHYDDDAYVIQWARSDIPSNTIAVLKGTSSTASTAASSATTWTW